MSQEPCAAGQSIVCVGTSPAMLFEGLRHARAGARVTFIDRADAIGGGWRTRDLFGFTGVEVGAHLFENRPEIAALLQSVLAPDELVVDEAGFGLVGKRRIPLRASRALLYAGLATKGLMRRDGEALAHSARNLRASAGNLREPLLYPRGGIAPLLARLHDLLHSSGAVFRWGVSLDRLEVLSGGIAVHGHGVSTTADRVIMSSRAHVPAARLDAPWDGLRASCVDSLVLLVDEDRIGFDGYVELIANPVIKRMRRLAVSNATRTRPLLVVQVRDMARDVDETARDVVREAARLGLLRGRVEPEGVFHERVTYRTLSARKLARIATFGQGRIATINTIDFSDPRPL